MTEAHPLLNGLSVLLATSPVHKLLPDVRAHVERTTGGRLRLWLADYRQRTLSEVLLSGSTAAAGSGRPGSGPAGSGRPHEASALGGQEATPDDGVRRDDTALVARPVAPALAEVRVDGSWPGRCFAAQTTLHRQQDGRHEVFLPLTVRGDRHGVVDLSLPREPSAELLAALEVATPLLATALGERPATDAVERPRRTQLLTVAAELQWALLPGRSYADADVTLAAMLEPAYSVAGDAYDWSRNGDQLHLVVADGTGRGVPAALTSTLALAALRNARLAGVSLADQAALADQAVFAHHGGEAFVSALLLRLDVQRSTAWVVDAGSPVLYLLRQQQLTRVELDRQLPLGMFEETVYVEQELPLLPGDRLVIVSDGVHGSRSRDGTPFGEGVLERSLREARLLSPPETVRQIMRRLQEELQRTGPTDRFDDDAVVLCLDWHVSR